ncbi:Drc1-Sld2 domain containing protein [Pyrenophora teres f. maculata]|nr:Drc1-Sld2 domain containing protein [Pyrenophora teres f. maculata]
MSNDEIEQRCNALRLDLKAWEKKFAAQNNGRKAGRDDIKANAEISQKYKEYNKLRARQSSKTAPQTPSKRGASRKANLDVERTPKAAPKAITTTPMKRKRDEEDSLLENIDQDQLLSPQGPTVIGPTPQRDGIVLGLFDELPFAYDTPSKPRNVLGDMGLNVPQTPSRRIQDAASETSLESRARGERTPLSAGKRFLLNQFVTPKKRRLDEQGTPSSALGLATPAFLRRDNVLSAIDEENEATPRPAPWKRRGLVRSLSTMIQAMKKDENDKLDEEADIMREMEMEEQGISRPRKKAKTPQLLVEDSQAPMPLGPDRGFESEDNSEEEPELGADGKPRKAWKKKGLKRQTRRVIMRPNITKPRPAPAPKDQDKSEEEGSGVPETQLPVDAAEEFGSDFDDESDYASDASHTPKPRKVTAKKPQQRADKPADQPAKEGLLKTAARKIKATANANYRRLNIKGKAATGGKSGKGKFGRRK